MSASETPVPAETAKRLWDRTFAEAAEEQGLESAQREALLRAAEDMWCTRVLPQCTALGIVVATSNSTTLAAPPPPLPSSPQDIEALREAVRKYRETVPTALAAALSKPLPRPPSGSQPQQAQEKANDDNDDDELTRDVTARMVEVGKRLADARATIPVATARTERIAALSQ
jgi:hypothetical protein